MMILTSTERFLAVSAIVFIFVGMAAGSHYYEHDRSYGISDSSSFSVPEYESQSELATQLVAPFIFIVILLRAGFLRVLNFAFATDDNDLASVMGDEPDMSKEATIMAIAVTAMTIPTPFWDWVRLVASSISLIATSAVVLVIGFLIYSFLSG